MATHSSVLAWRIPGTGKPWWAVVSGVAQSQTRLKRRSSSSSSSRVLDTLWHLSLMFLRFGNIGKNNYVLQSLGRKLVLFIWILDKWRGTSEMIMRRFGWMEYLLFSHLSCVQLFATPWIAAHQASLSSAISWSLLKFMSIELVMLSNYLILCHPLLLLPSIVPN